MKLVPKKNGKGYFTSFTLSFGSKEAKDLKLLDENGNVKKIKLAKSISDNEIQIIFENN
ncbi:MAG: hypothetical protein HFJ60_00960 [Clostridia bacterium]|jgi:hypothetical protein|nr:hypothetical protein [Clostridia bacterium]